MRFCGASARCEVRDASGFPTPAPTTNVAEDLPRHCDHDDDGFGSARHALSFMLAVGRAFLLAPRVSSVAGERSRERHRDRARLALPSSRRRAFRKRAFLRSRRDLVDRDGFPKGREASHTPANAPPSARCLALRRSRGKRASPGADFGSEPGLASCRPAWVTAAADVLAQEGHQGGLLGRIAVGPHALAAPRQVGTAEWSRGQNRG